MAKAQTYQCAQCAATSPKWVGQCPGCGEWNTLEEAGDGAKFTQLKGNVVGKSLTLEGLSGHAKDAPRIPTQIGELDRVLGGGLVPGSAILVGGDPGIGKSTLLLQMQATLANNGKKMVYITGEESVAQVRLRASRLGLSNAPVLLAAATNVRDILATMQKEKPAALVVDSIQTMFVDSVASAPGTVTQVRNSAFELIAAAKQSETALILVGHVTKDGQIAGPKVLEHMVDTVLYAEGDAGQHYRLLRAVKNRFGAANEIGVFDMTEQGLQEVTNPSALFISGKAGEVSGSVIFPASEGSRVMLLEIQALVAPTQYSNPKRAVVGWDANRLSMLLAVLQTRANLPLMDKEVFLNVTGGIKITEPAADLAVAAAIVSALKNEPVKEDTVVFGEVGLSGEVRPVSGTESRLKEAAKLGFTRALTPPGKAPSVKGLSVEMVKYAGDLVRS